MSRYYRVTAKCGHVGRKYYIKVDFAVVAEDGKEAAEKTRMFPRVKHDHPDCILDVNIITREEFLQLLEENNNDEYLKCKNKQEQNLLDLEDRLIEEPRYQTNKYKKKDNNSVVHHKKMLIKNPHKYFNRIYDYRGEEVE